VTAPQLYPKFADAVVVAHTKYRIRGSIELKAGVAFELELAKPMSRKPSVIFVGQLEWDKIVGVWRAVRPYAMGKIERA